MNTKLFTIFAGLLMLPAMLFAQEARHLSSERTPEAIDLSTGFSPTPSAVKFDSKELFFSEGFEGMSGDADFTGGWETYSATDTSFSDNQETNAAADGDNTWFVCTPESFQGDGGSYIHSGARSAAIGYSAGDEGNSFHWLVSPEISLPAATQDLRFWAWYQNSEQDGWYTHFYVIISADGGDTWTNLAEWIGEDGQPDNLFDEPVVLSLEGYEEETVQIAFVFEYNDGFQMGIDDVQVGEPGNDASVVAVNEPSGLSVTEPSDLIGSIQNLGTENLTETTLEYSVFDSQGNEETSGSTSWTGDLPQGEYEENLTFGNYDFNSPDFYTIRLNTSQPNGVEDERKSNDTLYSRYVTLAPGQFFEDFEEGVISDAWQDEAGGWEITTNSSYGDYSAWVGQTNGDPAERLITPAIQYDGNYDLKFVLSGLNNVIGAENNLGYSNLQVQYASSPDGSWTTLETFDMAEEGDSPQNISIDLSSLTEGETYYFAFRTTSTFDYQTFQSYVTIDDVLAPVAADAAENDLQIVNLVYPRNFVSEGETVNLKAVVRNVGLNEQSGNSVSFSVDGAEVGTANVESISYFKTDTVAVSWTATEYGKHSVSAELEADDNMDNNTASGEGLVVEPGILTEDFENPSSPSFMNSWSADPGWFPVAEQPGTDAFNPFQGDTAFICGGDEDGGPYENVRLVTPKLSRDQHYDTFYFYAKGANLTDSTQTTVQLQYTTDTASGSWSSASSAYVLNDTWQLYEVNLSGVPFGEVFFAFAAASDWESTDFVSYVLIDHVVGVSYPRPGVQYAIPYEQSTGVPLDSVAKIQFEEEVDVNDLSGVTITGENEGEVGNVSASLGADNKTMTINHDPYANNNEVYTVTVPYETVLNDRQVGNLEHSWSFTTIMAPPQAAFYAPAVDADGVPLDAEVQVRFNQEISAVNLTDITITGATEGAVGNVSAAIQEDGKTLAIAHDAFANQDEVYTVTIPAGAVANSDQVENEEISWSFTTRTAAQPVAEQLFPANNGIDVALDSTLYVVFDMDVTANDMSGVSIADSENNAVGNVSASLINANSADADTMMITHDAFSKYGEYYTATVPANAVTGDGANNGVITWQFKTLILPPSVVETVPADQATAVSPTQTLRARFDQPIEENDFSGITVEGATTGAVGGINALIVGSDWLYIQHDDLAHGETYTVTLPAGVVNSNIGVPNEGSVEWSFTTAYPDPAVDTLMPADSAVNQPVSGMLHAKFNTEVDSVDFSGITLVKSADQSSVSVTPYLNETDTMLVIPYADLEYGTAYEASVPAGAVANPDGVSNEAFSWSFTTENLYALTFHASYYGSAVEGVEISLGDGSIMTNADGMADTMLVNGSYDYTADKAGYDPVNGSVTIDGGDVTEEISMPGALALSFTVEDEDANPIEGAWVYLNTDQDSVETGADGSAAFPHLIAGSYDYEVAAQDYSSASGSLELSADTTVTVSLMSTGISRLQQAGIQVYPNPSQGRFQIEVAHTDEAFVRIYDLSGALILEKELRSSRSELNLQDQKNGIYIMEVHKDGQAYRSRLIKH